MPVLENEVPRRQSAERVQGTNKVKIPDGTRPATIVDVWIFYVDKDGKYTKEQTDSKKVQIKCRLTQRPDIVLAKRMFLSIGPKSMFGKLLQGLTGIPAGSDDMRQFNTDFLLDMDVLVTTEYHDPYTNITTISPPIAADDLTGVPAHEPPKPTINAEAIKAKLRELLNSNRLAPFEKLRAIKSVTGSEELSSIKDPETAQLVIEALEREIAAGLDEVPF